MLQHPAPLSGLLARLPGVIALCLVTLASGETPESWHPLDVLPEAGGAGTTAR